MCDIKHNIKETRRRIKHYERKRSEAGEEVIRIKNLLIDTEFEEGKLVIQLVKYEQHLRDLLKKRRSDYE